MSGDGCCAANLRHKAVAVQIRPGSANVRASCADKGSLAELARSNTLEYYLVFCQSSALTPHSICSGSLAEPETLTQQLQRSSATAALAQTPQTGTQLQLLSRSDAATPRESENTSNVGTTTGPRPAGEAQSNERGPVPLPRHDQPALARLRL